MVSVKIMLNETIHDIIWLLAFTARAEEDFEITFDVPPNRFSNNFSREGGTLVK